VGHRPKGRRRLRVLVGEPEKEREDWGRAGESPRSSEGHPRGASRIEVLQCCFLFGSSGSDEAECGCTTSLGRTPLTLIARPSSLNPIRYHHKQPSIKPDRCAVAPPSTHSLLALSVRGSSPERHHSILVAKRKTCETCLTSYGPG
jgi:hypothetical protein